MEKQTESFELLVSSLTQVINSKFNDLGQQLAENMKTIEIKINSLENAIDTSNMAN